MTSRGTRGKKNTDHLGGGSLCCAKRSFKRKAFQGSFGSQTICISLFKRARQNIRMTRLLSNKREGERLCLLLGKRKGKGVQYSGGRRGSNQHHPLGSITPYLGDEQAASGSHNALDLEVTPPSPNSSVGLQVFTYRRSSNFGRHVSQDRAAMHKTYNRMNGQALALPASGRRNESYVIPFSSVLECTGYFELR